MSIDRNFPSTRLRRLRKSANLRAMLAETHLTVSDLIQPIFIKENLSGREAIETMPGINRLGLDIVNEEIDDIIHTGIKSVAVFPVIDESKKDETGTQAAIEGNFINSAIRKIKESYPELVVIADVALDPYTTHGHDGILNETGDVDNDLTLPALRDQALGLAKAGTDIIAPSDMMDGRIKVIRDVLEQNDFVNTLILSYAAKYSSKFYGPFKDAVESAKFFGNKTKDTYQMPVSNINEALQEVSMDIQEGADIVMVKPGMPYLDVVKAVKDEFLVPTFVYQVSGEYSMLQTAVNEGLLSKEVIIESLLAFKRAGADCILTYFAKDVAKKIK
ncbi:MAG: porphobilinogen synthase [Pseudomonadota bacterium]|nr:porphobilinogen synthase [Pseudomonadota bacterium]MEE3294674.1 porphobilinogen synthase [Pseudomonadota bacterium]